MAGLRALFNRRSGPLILAVLLAGAFGRAVWLARHGLAHAHGEAMNVAIAFAKHGTISDPFGRGSGLSAHLNPILPLFAGTLYRLFGAQSTAAELILAAVTIGVAMLTAYLLFQAFVRLGMPPVWGLAALALVCLMPLNFELETITFRVWEGGITALFAAWMLVRVLMSDATAVVTWRAWLGLSALASIILFLNPAMGVAAFAMLGILMLRRAPFARWAGLVAASALVLALVLAPWTIRNYAAFGSFIPLRSNAGMELAVANHQAAVGAADDRQVFLDRLEAIHPFESDRAYQRMLAAGNERVYAANLGAEARSWILAHPAEFVGLSIKHVRQFYFPPAWQWSIYEESSTGTPVKQALIWLFTALGLVGAFAAALFWRGPWFYAVAMTLLPAATYAIVQPVLRYRYLVYAILIFLAVETVRRLLFARASFFASGLVAGRGKAKVDQPAQFPAAADHGVEYEPGKSA